MTGPEAIAILAAGMAAGAANTIAGAGSLITFPTLLAFGYAPVVANVSNTVGLVPGAVSGSAAYRRELAGQGVRLVRLGAVSVAGGLTGGVLLLALPGSTFERVVPFLVLAASALVAIQPWIARFLAGRRAGADRARGGPPPLLLPGIYLAAIYGGYFGAAQGVVQIALLGIGLGDDLQRINALKNALTAIINGVAAALFIVVANVAWPPAVLLAVGSVAGAQLGAIVGRRLHPTVLRTIIVIAGTAVGFRLLLG